MKNKRVYGLIPNDSVEVKKFILEGFSEGKVFSYDGSIEDLSSKFEKIYKKFITSEGYPRVIPDLPLPEELIIYIPIESIEINRNLLEKLAIISNQIKISIIVRSASMGLPPGPNVKFYHSLPLYKDINDDVDHNNPSLHTMGFYLTDSMDSVIAETRCIVMNVKDVEYMKVRVEHLRVSDVLRIYDAERQQTHVFNMGLPRDMFDEYSTKRYDGRITSINENYYIEDCELLF